MKLIFGLGNPEPRYERTRHNCGVMVVEELARQQHVRLELTDFPALAATFTLEGQQILIARSMVHMNCSGEALRKIMGRSGLAPEEILVVCDDFELDVGRLRFRRQGSSGGHKGLQSIIDALGTESFARLRVGIGPPQGDPVEFVLSPFSASERTAIEEAIEQAAPAALQWALQGIEICMNRYN